MNYFYDGEEDDVDDEGVETGGSDSVSEAMDSFQDAIDSLKKDNSEGDDTDQTEDTDTDPTENTDTDSTENTDTDSTENKDADTSERTDTDSSQGSDTQKDKKGKNEGQSGDNTKGHSQPDNKTGGNGSNTNNAMQQGTNQATQKATEEGTKKLAEEGTKELAKEGTKKVAEKAATQAATNAAASTAGAGAAAASAVVLFWVAVVIVCIIIIVGLIMFFLTVPGMLSGKLGEFFANFGKRIATFFGFNDTTNDFKNEDMYEILDYLEEMGYDLKGYGFLTGDADAGLEYGEEGNDDVLRNSDGLISSKIELKKDEERGKKGELVETTEQKDVYVGAYSDFVQAYLVSDNYVYTVKNFNKNKALDNFLTSIGFSEVVKGKGLLTIKFENANGGPGKDYEINELDSLFGWSTTWTHIKMDPDVPKMTIRRGWGANKIDYKLDGWTGRYGMPLEFLLSVHIATMKPDLAYQMATSFETNIDILLRNVSDASVKAFYYNGPTKTIDKENKTVSISEKENMISYDTFKNEKGKGMDGWFLTKEEAYNILKKYNIESPDNCTYSEETSTLLCVTADMDGKDHASHDDLTDTNKWAIDGKDVIGPFESIYDDVSNLGDAYYNKEPYYMKEGIIKVAEKESEPPRYDRSDVIATLTKDYPYMSEAESELSNNGGNYPWNLKIDKSIISKEHEKHNEDIQKYEEDLKKYKDGEISTEPTDPIEDVYVSVERDELGTKTWKCKEWNGTYIKSDKSEAELTVSLQYQTVIREWKSSVGGEEVWRTWITCELQVIAKNPLHESNGLGETFIVDTYYTDVYYRDKPASQLGNTDESGEKKKCSDGTDNKKCCGNCKKHIKKIMKELKKVDVDDFKTYVPYLYRVEDHWFRDVYFKLSKDEVNSIRVTKVDYAYEKETNERWTEYVKNENNPEIDQLYIYENGVIGEKYNEDYDGDGIAGTQKDADAQNVRVVRKQEKVYASSLDGEGEGEEEVIELKSDGSWSAYTYDEVSDTEQYTKAYDKDDDEAAAKDEIKGKIYYQMSMKNTVVQKQDAIRGVTNEKIKDMFLNRRYFTFDGTTERAEIISKLREKVADKKGEETYYGDVPEEYLELSVTVDGETHKVEDYVSTVSLNMDSLGAFTILENTHTLDADYIYKDFKELIVELGFFTKEDLSDNPTRVLEFLIPDIGTKGFPYRKLDKNENEYGTFIHSSEDINVSIDKNMQELIKNKTVSPGKAVEDSLTTSTSLKMKAFNEKDGLFVKVASLENLPTNKLQTVGSGLEVRPVQTTFQSIGAYSDAPGAYTGDVTIDGVTYKMYKQTESTCTLYSYAFIAQVYTDIPMDQFLKDANGNLMCGGTCCYYSNEYWNAGAQWYAFESKIDGSLVGADSSSIVEALSQGKPVMFYGKNFIDGPAYSSYPHAVVLLGSDDDGKILLYNPSSGAIEHYGSSSNFQENINYIVNNYAPTRVYVPSQKPTGSTNTSTGEETTTPSDPIVTPADDEDDDTSGTPAPVSTKEPYTGFVGGEKIVSPVTGILVDYGTYEEGDSNYRANIDKTEAVDKVGYAKILVLNKEISNQIEDLEKVKEIKNYAKIKGYTYFAEEYESAGISGWMIYIDGFKAKYDSLDELKGNASILSSSNTITDCVNTESEYEGEVVYELASKEKKTEEETEAKDKKDATYLFKFSPSVNEVIQEVLIIKAGTVLGETFDNETLVTEYREETYDDVAKGEIQGNYIRVIMRDLNDTVIENVEDYMKYEE